MSIPNRILNIGKSYLNQMRDRIDDALAEKELDMSATESGLPDKDDASPDAMMQRAQARIDAARRELEARQRQNGDAPLTTAPPAVGTPTRVETSAAATNATDPNAADYKVMGLPVGSELTVVVAKYEELVNRCDPRRFPEGSEEQATAKAILAKVNISYDALRKRLDLTENRFSKLELE